MTAVARAAGLIDPQERIPTGRPAIACIGEGDDTKLGVPFNPSAPAMRYEHSMKSGWTVQA